VCPLWQTAPHDPHWLALLIETHEPPQQYSPLPHEVPLLTERVQLCVCLVLLAPHAPPEQACVVAVRLCVPVVSHALE
jgi:hypothetical protein